jgi:hypothetical protein
MAENTPEATPIEVHLEKVSQLFNTLDPYPFAERDLDKDAEEYIVGWARELPRDTRIRIVIHLPATELVNHDQDAVASALNRYFDYRSKMTERDFNELLRVGRMALLIGLSVLALCLTLARFTSGLFGELPLGRFVQESLIILGWVANWKPIEIFLYDWWPLIRMRNLYRRLAGAAVELRPYSPAGAPA